MTALLWLLAVVGVLALAWTVVVSAARVRRLHRLHIRTDAARAGLGSALDRRAAAALAVADVLAVPDAIRPELIGPDAFGPDLVRPELVEADLAAGTGPGSTGPGSTGPGSTGPGSTGPGSTGPGSTTGHSGPVHSGPVHWAQAARPDPLRGTAPEATAGVGELRAAAAAARATRGLSGDREAAENRLGRALGALDHALVPPALLEELIDAEQLVILARRVHNDAVRDTLTLRSRRLVRWLHLAGTAAMPAYFEIADADAGVTTAAPFRQHERPVGPPH